jgi:DNA sulfur modification protein DndB
MDSLLIPALFGNYQHWPYYQIILPVEEIVKNFGTDQVPNYRFKTTDEVEVIYSQRGVNNLLQRVLDNRRLEPIRRFINEQPEAYVNNLTVAIYGGDPQWLNIDVQRSMLLEEVSDDSYENIATSLGLIKLNGDETLFVLDGQHRLKALRLAYLRDPSIGSNQITLSLITHIDTEEGKKKTRRLFSIINRYAKPVSLGESILLDEDDLSAIIVRKLIEEYPLFQNRELVALNKTADLKLPKDRLKFSTVIALWKINETLVDPRAVYPPWQGGKTNLIRIRPDDRTIEEYFNFITLYWDNFFHIFPNAAAFVNDPLQNLRQIGGPLSLRPIGQAIFAEYYMKLATLDRLDDLAMINIVPDDLNDPFWHFVLFDPISNRIIGSQSFARDYIYYHLDLPLSVRQYDSLLRNYRNGRQDDEVELPVKLINNH